MRKTGLETLLEEFEKNPDFHVQYATLELQESICRIHKNQGLRIEILLWIIQWCADMAIKIKPKDL